MVVPEALVAAIPPSEASAPGSTEGLVQGLAGYAGLHHRQEILGAHFQHPVHAREIQREGRPLGNNLAFDAGSGSKGHHRDAVLAGPGQGGLNVLEAFGVDHRHGRVVGWVALILAVDFQIGGGGADFLG